MSDLAVYSDTISPQLREAIHKLTPTARTLLHLYSEEVPGKDFYQELWSISIPDLKTLLLHPIFAPFLNLKTIIDERITEIEPKPEPGKIVQFESPTLAGAAKNPNQIVLSEEACTFLSH